MNNKVFVAVLSTFFVCFFSPLAIPEQNNTVDDVWHVLHKEGVAQAKTDHGVTPTLGIFTSTFQCSISFFQLAHGPGILQLFGCRRSAFGCRMKPIG